MAAEQTHLTPPEVSAQLEKATGESWSAAEIRGIGRTREGVIILSNGRQLWPVDTVTEFIDERLGADDDEAADGEDDDETDGDDLDDDDSDDDEADDAEDDDDGEDD